MTYTSELGDSLVDLGDEQQPDGTWQHVGGAA